MYYIYKKTHNVTGLKYLGYTKRNPYTYTGSGIRWTRHIETHGNDVTTVIIHECINKEEVKHVGRYYSELWNVVESREWANIKVEEADGGDMRHSEKWKAGRVDPTFKKKQADGAKGNTNVRGRKWWYNERTGQRARCIESPGSGWTNTFKPDHAEQRINKLKASLAGKPKSEQHKASLSKAAKGKPSNSKGTIWVVDQLGIRKRVAPHSIPEGFKRVSK